MTLGVPYASGRVEGGRLIRTCPKCGEEFTERTDRYGEQTTWRYAEHYQEAHQAPQQDQDVPDHNQTQEVTMATATQQDKKDLAAAGINPDAMPSGKSATAEKFVYDALQKNGFKFKDLTEEQRARALAAPTEKAGLRGKALATWIVDGLSIGQQVQQGRAQVQQEQSAKRSEAAKARGQKPPARESKYPQDVRDAVKRSNAIRGKSHGAGPKQHVAIREVVTRELASQQAEPTPLNLARLAGFKSIAELFAAAAGEADRAALKGMQPLAAKMGDDPWCKGRHLAAALAAWAEQLQGAK